MMRATKYILILCVVLNLLGHPMESKVVGWDYCTEDGHPFVLNVYKFGWPIPVVEYIHIWGCLATPNSLLEFSWSGLIGSQIFWIVAIWIIDTYWPFWKPDCPYYYLCADKEVSKEICGTCKILRISEAMRK